MAGACHANAGTILKWNWNDCGGEREIRGDAPALFAPCGSESEREDGLSALLTSRSQARRSPSSRSVPDVFWDLENSELSDVEDFVELRIELSFVDTDRTSSKSQD